MKENQKSDIAPQDKQWEWIPCQYDVKRISKDTETTWNLSPSVQLKIPSEQGQIDPVIDLKIEQSRNFIYTNKNGLGWNWHKSWNLPDIGVELEITDPTTDEKLAPPGKIYAKIQIVKPTVSPMKTFHLLEVGVKGNQKMDLENNKCIFSGLKFNTTSYNHDHQNFTQSQHFIFVKVSLNSPNTDIPHISPIFVDSRKSARDIEQQNKQKLQSYFDPFPITTLEKQFTTTKPQNTEVITNTIEGLNNYFSAPNIRHKVKHPVFLCIKFSSCIKLYLNTNVFKFQDSKSLVLTIQQVLYKSTNNNVNNKLDQKYIILCVDSSNTIKFLEPFNNDDIEVVIDPIELPKNFTQITDLADIKQAYIDVYDKLLQLKKNEQQQDDNQEYEEQPRKKKKPKEQEVVQNNQEKIIRKVIQIQGPNISQQRSHHTHVIQSAEMLIEQQHQYLDKEHVKEEHIVQEENPINLDYQIYFNKQLQIQIKFYYQEPCYLSNNHHNDIIFLNSYSKTKLLYYNHSTISIKQCSIINSLIKVWSSLLGFQNNDVQIPSQYLVLIGFYKFNYQIIMIKSRRFDLLLMWFNAKDMDPSLKQNETSIHI